MAAPEKARAWGAGGTAQDTPDCFFSCKEWGTPRSRPSSALWNTSRSACLSSSRLGGSTSVVPGM